MLHLILGRAGTGKTYKVRNMIKELVLNGTDGVILLVPEQYSFESERALLRLLGPANAVKAEVLSFSRLCNRVFGEYGGFPGKRIDDAGRAVLMGQALLQISGELKLYGRQAGSAEFVNTMLSIVSELKQWCVTPDDLIKASSKLNEGLLKLKAEDLSLILGTYQAVTEQSYIDPLDDLTMLAEKLDSCNFFDGKTVFIDSFKGFTVQQLNVLERIIKQSAETYITLCTDSINTDDNDLSLFSNVNKTAAKLTHIAKKNFIKVASPEKLINKLRYKNKELEFLEENLFNPAYEKYEETPQDIQICAAGTVYDEADFTAKTIKKLVRENGLRYREIAVIARNIEDYRGIIDTAFKKYEIPLFMDTRNPVDSKPIMRFILSAFDIVGGGFDSDDIFTFLKTGLANFSTDEISKLENYVTIWGISGKRWFTEWKSNPDGFVEGFDDNQKAALSEINSLRRKVIYIIDKFKNNLICDTAEGFATAAYKLLTESGADSSLREYASRLEAEGEVKEAEDERRTWDILMGIFDQTVNALSDLKLDSKRYAEYLNLAVSLADMGSLPQGLDEVSAGSAERMRPAQPKAVFVIGLNEGVFPKVLGSGGIFSGRDRAKLIDLGIEIADNAETEAVDENFLLYSSICAASESVYLSYVRADASGKTMAPSPVISFINSVFPKINIINERFDYENTEEAVSGIEAEKPAVELTARVWNLNSPLTASLKEYFKDNEILKAVKSAENRDFKLKPENADKLFRKDINISATRIEVFHKCRFSYFCKYGINAKPFRTAELDVLERGSLVHYVLEKLICKYGGKGLAAADKAEISREIRELIDKYIIDFLGGKEDKSKRLLFLFERIAVLLESLTEHIAADFSQSLFEPAFFELPIDDSESGIHPAKIKLPDGGSITVRGKIDRVDTYRDGGKVYVRIVDYKTGSRKFNLNDVLYGLNLQMLVYLFAIRAGGGDKIKGEIIPSGILYMPSKRPSADISRYSSEDELTLSLRKGLKMSGLILNDSTVLTAMEKDGLGIFTPFKLNKDGTPSSSSSVADAALLGSVENHINKLLVKMGKMLHNGDIAVSPLDGTDSGACDYCDYRGACGKSESDENEKIKKLDKEELAKAFEVGDENAV